MNLNRTVGVAIVLFWCFMNVLLVKRQIAAPPAPIALATVSAITEPLDEWWGVYFHGEKIGYSSQKITPRSSGGYDVHSSSVLRLNLMETTQTVTTRLEMSADPEWALKQFAFQLDSNNVRFNARGSFAAGKLRLELNSGAEQSATELALRQPPYLLAALKPYVVTQNLEPGKEHIFPTFDPATLSQQLTAVTIEGRERIQIGGKMEPAIRLRQQFKGISVISWVDGAGRTLKEESPTGMSLVKENAEQAVSIPGTRSLSLDLLAQTAVPVQTPIADPRRKEFLRLKLSGFDLTRFALDGDRQRLDQDELQIKREALDNVHSYALPARGQRFASYLQPTPFLQSDHPRIRAVARSIVGAESDAVKAAARIKDWVYRELAKEPTVSIPNALEVLRTKKGDCNEHAVLFNALARAAGIPAKTAVGVVYLRGAFYYHAWSEVWLGEWVSLDPVLNQFPADATHVKFLEGEIDRQVDILQLIGNLKIRVMEAS
ncbi:MAG TPA: transglutaminase-like domain-containing protein [Candidatus Binatia bacterium]